MPDIDINQLLLLVTGASLRAEAADRPLAYHLQHRAEQWLEEHVSDDEHALLPLVCGDIWYLNHQPLHRRPVICIGGPGANALSAYLYPRLPTAVAVEERFTIQLDVELADLRVNLWGMDHAQTAGAVELFENRYLEDFLHAASERQGAEG